MVHEALRTLLEALEVVRPAFTRPGFGNLVVVFAGWILRRLAEEAPVRVVTDDTLATKKGPHVFGIGSHIDAVRSTRRQKIFAFGHCWVVLAVLLPVPFSSRTFALPVLFRLYRTVKSCGRAGQPHRKKTELARELLDVLARWVGARRVEISADSAYCNGTVTPIPSCSSARCAPTQCSPLLLRRGPGDQGVHRAAVAPWPNPRSSPRTAAGPGLRARPRCTAHVASSATRPLMLSSERLHGSTACGSVRARRGCRDRDPGLLASRGHDECDGDPVPVIGQRCRPERSPHRGRQRAGERGTT